MSIHEIVLAGTKPETEWVLGRAVQKVSGTYSHGRLQMHFAEALTSWADSGCHGRTTMEWRFRVAPRGEIVRPLVPDVAYLSYSALPADAPSEAYETPLGAPTVAVEILSPDDRPRNVAHKIATFLSAGSDAVIVVDPQRFEVFVHDAAGIARFTQDDELTHAALPGFALGIRALFDRALG